MSRPHVRVTCPKHEGVTVLRIERDPAGGMVAVFWTRTDVGRNGLGGRAAEPSDETRLRLDTVRNIPYVVTWCRKCRREYEVPFDWIRKQAETSSSGSVLSFVPQAN